MKMKIMVGGFDVDVLMEGKKNKRKGGNARIYRNRGVCTVTSGK